MVYCAFQIQTAFVFIWTHAMMAAHFCNQELEKLAQIANNHGSFMLTYCVLNLIFPLVTSVENILVIHALWNASSIPANIKKFFLNLAFSDLAVGLIAQLMSGVMVTALIIAAYKNYSNSFLCPTILTFCYFVNFFLAGASFFTVIAIGIDRFLAITLHLRYREHLEPCFYDVSFRMANEWCSCLHIRFSHLYQWAGNCDHWNCWTSFDNCGLYSHLRSCEISSKSDTQWASAFKLGS